MKNSFRRRAARSRSAAVIAAAAGAALVTACGGSHAPAPGATAGQPTRQEVDTFAQCMRSHGVTNFYLSRPGTPSDNDEIPIGFLPYGVVVNVDPSSPQFQSASSACQHLLPGSAPPSVTAAQLRSMDGEAACMRAHGFPAWPDPEVQNGHLVPSPLPSGINENSPQFQAVFKTCHPEP